MIKTLGSAMLLFFVQPLVWVGLLASWKAANNRLNNERKALRVAVFKEKFEVKNYLTKGLLIGLIVSVFIYFSPIPITGEFILMYQAVSILFMLLGYRFLHPLFTVSASMLLVIAYTMFIPEMLPSLSVKSVTLFDSVSYNAGNLAGFILLFSALLTVLTSLSIMKTKNTQLSPTFNKTKRGKTIASYSIKPLWLIPIFLFIPGKAMTSVLPWWPVFSVGGVTKTFVFFPILLGMQYTVKTQFPDDASFKVGKENLFVALVALVTGVISFWYPGVSLVGLVLSFFLAGFVLYRHRARERKWQFLYGPSEEGWKVVGVRPDTPAEIMELEPGDTILECNQVTKEITEDFYDALAANRVYCKLRIKRADGQIRLAETAIYDDASHDLGIVVIEDAPYL